MKIGRLRTIWPLSPRTAAQSLELSCWLAAAGLVLALALATVPAVGAFSAPSAAARPEDPHVLILQRRCIDRILGQSAEQSGQSVLEQINQRCMTPPRAQPPSPPRLTPRSCGTPFAVRLIPVDKRIAGCLRT